jgi:protein tyrosine phosphatase (PTP) superfamily phosphohydrolase (DUF442 family)
VVCAVLLGLCTAAAQSPVDSPHAVPVHKETPGIRNFGQVTPYLYRGGQPSVQGLENLKTMGVSIVVDMRGGPSNQEESAVRKLGMQYVPIPWHCPFPNDKPFIRFLKVIAENPDKKIFVHCRLGDDRTGMAIAAYRMADEGWSADEAMREMNRFGFTGIHHAICPALAHFEKEFPEHLKTNPAFQELRFSKVKATE